MDIYQQNIDHLNEGACLVPPLISVEINDAMSVQRSDDGQDGNIFIDGQPLFENGIRGYSTSQVGAYLKSPKRIEWPLRGFDPTLNLFSANAVRDVLSYMQGEILEDRGDLNGGFLFLFGIGLGVHLEMLLEKLPVRNLFIVETNPALLHAALQYTDFNEIEEMLINRGGSLRIFSNPNPEALVAELVEMTRLSDLSLLDGSYIFQYYEMPPLQKAVDLFLEAVPSLTGGIGFVEDEMFMWRHSLENLARRDFGWIKGNHAITNGNPWTAVIVGSGPSVEDNIEEIRRLSNNAIIFSGSSSLKVVLANGIEPDFHCEMERDPLIPEVLEWAIDNEKCGKTRLIINNSCHPDVANYFNAHLLHFREAVSPSLVLADPEDVLYHTNPIMMNSAVATAISLGFREIILFGADYGSQSAEKTHASSTIHNQGSDFYKDLAANNINYAFNIPQRGLSDAIIYTNKSMLESKRMLERLINYFPDADIKNCSAGLHIAGTQAVKGKDVDVKDLAADADAIVDLLPILKAGECLNNVDLLSLQDSLNELNQKLASMIEKSDSFYNLYENLQSVLPCRINLEADRMNMAAQAFYRGSFESVMQFAFFFYKRLAIDRRATFMAILKAALTKELLKAKFQISELFRPYIEKASL